MYAGVSVLEFVQRCRSCRRGHAEWSLYGSVGGEVTKATIADPYHSLILSGSETQRVRIDRGNPKV